MVLLVVVYVPLGAALARARPGTTGVVAAAGGGGVVSIVVELSQYQWLDRVASLDDVVITTTSTVVGWLVVAGLRRRDHARRAANP